MSVLRPGLISNPDLTDLECATEEYMNALESGEGYVDEDLEHFIFEEAMKAFYGENVFEHYINKKLV